VVNTPEQVKSVGTIITASCVASLDGVSLDVIAEPKAWRGAAGIVRDATDHVSNDCDVMVCEAKRLPPAQLSALVNGFAGAGAVGTCGRDEPAGVYLFSRDAIRTAPSIGYFDLKEQFIPSLRDKGHGVVSVCVGDAVRRIQDLDSYLECVRFSLDHHTGDRRHRIADQAFIASSAVLSGRCIIEAGAVIDERAVVHDSVLLWGATVSAGAVVNRCLIGSFAVVEPRIRLTRTALPANGNLSNQQLSENFVLAR
jgi:hypothetical protein